MGIELCVSNLGENVSASDLIQLFGRYGRVEQADVAIDAATHRNHGFGFVEMESEAAAQAALSALNGTVVAGREIRVREASQGPCPGQFGDRSGK
jgi:RNA recognition motif-containing protein